VVEGARQQPGGGEGLCPSGGAGRRARPLWLRERGSGAGAGEFVSTGTCTGHLFALPGDTVVADFGDLGPVQARFVP
jgi:hypothetical protein